MVLLGLTLLVVIGIGSSLLDFELVLAHWRRPR